MRLGPFFRLALLLVMAVGSVLACRDKTSPREQILRLIDRAVVAAEKRDLDALNELVYPRYSDGDGRRARDMRQLILFHVLRARQIAVYPLHKDVSVEQGDRPSMARATVTAVVTRDTKRASLPSVLPESARKLTFDITFRRTDDTWQVSSLSWD